MNFTAVPPPLSHTFPDTEIICAHVTGTYSYQLLPPRKLSWRVRSGSAGELKGTGQGGDDPSDLWAGEHSGKAERASKRRAGVSMAQKRGAKDHPICTA